MKDYLQVQKDRIKYHVQPFKNTVHRSSLIAPRMEKADTWISFINHFLIKRGYKSVALKINAVDKNGHLLDSKTIQIEEPKVYSINLSQLFEKIKVNNFLIDFFSERNLFIPFPAVIISHLGKDFCNISSGILDIKDKEVYITYEKKKYKVKKKIKVSLPRLSYKSFYLSKILPKNIDGG